MGHPPRSTLVLAAAMLSVALVGCATDEAASIAAATDDHASLAAESTTARASGAAVDDEAPADATRLGDGDTIAMRQFAFSDSAVVVPVGATLTFSNEDNVFHTVTNGVQGFAAEDAAFDQPVEAGESIEITFDEPGRYEITCEPHPIMQMTVFVEG